MTMNLCLHRKQFIITDQPIHPAPDWHSIRLFDNYRLFYQADLQVVATNTGGRKRFLVGYRFEAAQHPHDALISDAFTGRFVWIDWPYLYTDAAALLSVYFSKTVQGGALISSSPALMAQVGRRAVGGRDLRWGGLNWIPIPGSRVESTHRLFRDQRLHIPSLMTEYVNRTITPLHSFEAARDNLTESLTSIARDISRRPQKIYLALTAGLDSRTVAASLLAAGVKFECITQSFPGPNNREVNIRKDIEVARRICSYLGVSHHIIVPQPRHADRLQLWKDHTLVSYSDADNAHLFPCDQYGFLQRGDYLIRSGCFDLGRLRSFAARLNGLTYDNATGESLWSRFEKASPDATTVAYFDRWLSWRKQHPNGLDLVDAFYLEQRIGGWLSALEQALDSVAGTSIQPANCGAVYSALITPDVQDRKSGRLQWEVIARLEPRLLKFPFNPVSTEEKIKRALHQAEWAAKRALKRVLPPSLVKKLQR